MKLSTILANIDTLAPARGMSDQQISLAAGMSRDGIRNWRRRLAAEGDAAGVNAASLARIAKALGVSTLDLAAEGGATPGTYGFAEPEVAQWKSAPDTTLTADRVLAVFGGDLKRPSVFRSRIAQPGLGILSGDILVVDLDGKPEQGDTVLATVADLETGQAETVIRQYQPPFIIALDPGIARPVLRLDLTGAVAIMGVITAIVRDRTKSKAME